MTKDQYESLCKYIKDGKTIEIHIKDTTAQFEFEEAVISFKIKNNKVTTFYMTHILEDEIELKEVLNLLFEIDYLQFNTDYDAYNNEDIVIISEYEKIYDEFDDKYYFKEYFNNIQNSEIESDIKKGYFKEKLIDSIFKGADLILSNKDKNGNTNYISIEHLPKKTKIDSSLNLNTIRGVVDYIYKLDINENNIDYINYDYSQIEINICDPYIKKQFEEKQEMLEQITSLSIKNQINQLAKSIF